MDKTIKCIKCGAEICENDDFCTYCGSPRPSHNENYCINKNCERFKKVLDNPEQQFCGKCGKPTSYGNYLQKLPS